MHEELYLDEKSKLKYWLLAIGVLLLPLSFFSFSLADGMPEFSFSFDLPLLSAAILFIVIFFDKQVRSMMRFSYPYIAVLIMEFLRFGTVSLFNRFISFEYYIVSAVIMGCAFGYTFILCFIGQGKMRTRLPLFAFSALNFIIAAVSPIMQIIPFVAYSDTVEGKKYFSISYLAAFVLLNIAALCITLCLKDDRAKAERRRRREEKRAERFNRR